MSDFRRRLLLSQRKSGASKTILAQDFQATGETLYFYNNAFDVDAQTVFADIVLDNTTEILQCVFDIGLRIHEWGPPDTYAIHQYYPTTIGGSSFSCDLCTANTRIKISPSAINNRVKCAYNANGYYMNGIKLTDDMASGTSAFMSAITNKIRDSGWVEIGSVEGVSRSYAFYNEVSIYHGLLSEAAMQAMTTI